MKSFCKENHFIEKKLKREKNFEREKGVVHAISRAQVCSPKLPIQVYIMICVLELHASLGLRI